MKKLLFLIVTLLAVLPLAKGQSNKYVYDNDPEQYVDSVVRIFCFNPDDASKGVPSETLDLGGGVSITVVPWSCGTGFVINTDKGYIVTNNHVVAVTPSARKANSVIFVVETVTSPSGKKRWVHKANVVWFSPKSDLAIIQCKGLQAKAIPLDSGEVKPEQDVYTMGYPGMSDQIAAGSNFAQEQLIKEHLIPLFVEQIKKEVLAGSPNLTDKDVEPDTDMGKQIEQKAEDLAGQQAQESNFDNCIGQIADQINPTWNTQANDTWEITGLMNDNPSWNNYFDPTQNDGKVQKLTDDTSFMQSSVPVPMIQHSIAIQHGNSGGPLLSDRGGVIGVVGDGLSDEKEGEVESANYATQVSEIVKGLSSITGGSYENLFYVPRRTLIVGGLALLVVAIGLFFLSFNTQRTAAPVVAAGGSKSDAAAYGVTVPSKQGGAKGADRTIPAGAGKSGSGWVLSGRGTGGKNLRVEFNEGLFTRNGGRLIIGRNSDLSHLVLDTNDVSRQHAQIRKEGNTFFIADRNSSNRTAVNGQFTGTPFQEVSLREGDTLTFGEVKVEFNRL